jgi:hypothetical protein
VLVTARVLALALVLASSLRALPARAADPRSEKREASSKGHVLLHVGATYRHVYDIPIYGEEFGACFGKWSERGSDCADLSLLIGRTRAGLLVTGVSFGYRADFTRGPVYVGILPRIGTLGFGRVTNGGRIAATGISLAAFYGVQLYRGRNSALALEAAFNLDLYDALIWGPTLAFVSRL